MRGILRPLQAACASACAVLAPVASAGIIANSVQVVDPFFNAVDVPIGPGDTNVGPDLGIFAISSSTTGSSLLVNGGSTLAAGRLVTASTASEPPAQVVVSGSGSSIELLEVQQKPTGFSAVDLASQGFGNLTISGGGRVGFSPSAAPCTNTLVFSAGPLCFVANFTNGAGSTASVTVTGAGSVLDLNPEHLDPATFHVTGIGRANVQSTGFGTPGGDSTATVSILNGGTFETDSLA